MNRIGCTVSVIVIGDEILYGERQDTHSYWLAKLFCRYSFQLMSIQILPDVLHTLVSAIQEQSHSSDYLFTLGGIGATHDDLTRQAVADAFGKKLLIHLEAEKLLKTFYGQKLRRGVQMLSELPEGSQLICSKNKDCYGFRVHNVFSFPGFPELSRPLIQSILPTLENPEALLEKRAGRLVTVFVDESELIHLLSRVQNKFADVSIGSYPTIDPKRPRVRIKLRGEINRINQAVKWMEPFIQKAGLDYLLD